MLHRMFQKHHITPDQFHAKRPLEQRFLIASELLVMEAEAEQVRELENS